MQWKGKGVLVKYVQEEWWTNQKPFMNQVSPDHEIENIILQEDRGNQKDFL